MPRLLVVTWLADLRYAARMLARAPGFSLVAILTVALGIGANVTIFSVVDTALLRPLPFRGAGRLMYVWTTQGEDGGIFFAPRADLVHAWQGGRRSLEALEFFDTNQVLLDGQGDPERVQSAAVSPSLFAFLGVRPRLGRSFGPADGAPGSSSVAIISHRVWTRRFGGDRNVLGRTITVDGAAHAIVGVMPPRFTYPFASDLWIPRELGQGRKVWNVIARLAEGASPRQAEAELQALANGVMPPSSGDPPRRVRLMPPGAFAGEKLTRALWVLFGAVGCVLLVACVNVASLLLARGTHRRRELAVRVALGAGRRRLVRQLLVESLVLAVAGGAGGLLVALWGLGTVSALRPEDLQSLGEPSLDARAVAFTTIATALASLLFGLWPSLQATRADVSQGLKSGDQGDGGSRGWRSARHVLVAAEIAIALVLLAGAGLLVNSFVRLSRVDPGFRSEGLVFLELTLPESRYGQSASQVAFTDALLARLRAVPFVEAAAIGLGAPPRAAVMAMTIATEAAQDAPPRSTVAFCAIDEQYFGTMGIRMVDGRGFEPRDDRADATAVIVSESMARRYWPGTRAVGSRVNLGSWGWQTVVGVSADVRAFGLASPPPQAQIYLPYRRMPWRLVRVAIRMPATTQTIKDVKAQVWATDRDQPIDSVTPASVLLADSLDQARFYTFLLGVFALTGVVLAAVGVYGLLSQVVSRRTREIGIRVALGGRQADILGLVFGQAMRMTAAGVAVVVCALTAVAAVATLVPARRATRVDPIEALRAE